MAQSPYPVVGAEHTDCHPRLELRDLQQNSIQFSLFIRALRKLQDMRNDEDKDRPNSWWQIGGIHGLPYEPWSGDPNGPQKRATPSDGWGGYCYHTSALFPSWHRVLLLLVEQAVVNEAIAIACELEKEDCATLNEGWAQAARELRFPFWDWTRPETAKEGIPKICQEPVVTIANPGGSRSHVPNPLNHYKYVSNPGPVKGLEYMGAWERTYRWANRKENPTKEDYDQATKAFSQAGRVLKLSDRREIHLQPVSWLRQKVAELFTFNLTVKDPGHGPNMWAYFSNTGAADQGVEPPMPIMPSSIEESHNAMHLDIGGNGSMTANEYSGFDPIFFLHHGNIDRIYAFWEYLYPDYWIDNGWKNSKTGKIEAFKTNDGTFYQNMKTSIDRSTPLHPFRSKVLDYWTSDDARGLLCTSPVNKYYTYPPITDPRTSTKVQVDAPYDKNNLALRQQYQQVLLNEWGPDLHSIVQTHQELSPPFPCLDLLMKVENGLAHLRQFAIVGRLPEFAFSGSYRLELYLLPKVVQPPSGFFKKILEVWQQVTGLWGLGIFQQGTRVSQQTSVHVVNNITVLGRSDPVRCAACKDRQDTGSHVRGYMHLDPRVILYIIASHDHIQFGEIAALNHVCCLIQHSFGLRLVRPDGTELAVAEPDTAGSAHHVPFELEEAKLPKLSLHSHVMRFDNANPTASIQFGEHTTHGTFAATHKWKVF